MAKPLRLRIILTEAEGRKVNQFCSLIRTHSTECVAFVDSLVARYGEPNVRGKLTNIGREKRYLDVEDGTCEAEYVKLFSAFLRLEQTNICQRFLDDCRAKGWVSAEHLVKDAPLVDSGIRKRARWRTVAPPREEVEQVVVDDAPQEQEQEVTEETVDAIEEVEEDAPMLPAVEEEDDTPPFFPEQEPKVTVNRDDLFSLIEFANDQSKPVPAEAIYKLTYEVLKTFINK